MNGIDHGKGRVPSISGHGWRIDFDTPEKMRYTIAAGSLKAVSEPVVINGMAENTGLPGKPKIHLSEDELESSLEEKTVIPFGSEPEIHRSFKTGHNTLNVTTDLVMRASPGMENISAGGFTVTGKVQKVSIYTAEGKILTPELKNTLFESEEMPLSIVFEDGNGAQLEFSASEDLWRWNAASRMNGKAQFKLTRKADGSFVWERIIFTWIPHDDEQPQPGRLWRLGELAAWAIPNPEKTQKKSRKKPVSVFDCAAYEWPESLLCTDADGKIIPGQVCFAANAVNNILKKWLRGNLEQLRKKRGGILQLKNVNPGLCFNASHQDRPKMKSLQHSSLRSLAEFRRWAEKQLIRCNATLEIIPAKGAFLADLPSLKGKTE